MSLTKQLLPRLRRLPIETFIARRMHAVMFAAASLLATPAFTQELDGQLRAKVLEQAKQSFVAVEAVLRLPHDVDTRNTLDREHERLARDRKSQHLMGVAISPREVLVPDTGIDARRVERWIGRQVGGKAIPLKPSAVMIDTPAIVLSPSDPDASFRATEFANGKPRPNHPLLSVRAIRVTEEWVLQVSMINPVAPLGLAAGNAGQNQEESSDDSFWVLNSNGGTDTVSRLVFDESGSLLGAATGDRIYSSSDPPLWRGEDLAEAERIGMKKWQETTAKVVERISPQLYAIRIEYRRPKTRSKPYDDSELVGWAIGPRRLFVLLGINRLRARYISRIVVQVEEDERECQFVGNFKKLDGLVLELSNDQDALPHHGDPGGYTQLAGYEPHVGLALRQQYGEFDLETRMVRPLGKQTRYGGAQKFALVPPPRPGSLLLDRAGVPIGVYTRLRRPMEELDLYMTITQSRSRSLTQPMLQSSLNVIPELFTLSNWAERLRHPEKHFDPLIMPRSEEDENRRVWLGIEYNPVSRELAESLECRKATKDGGIGLMVGQVYPDSPAAELGIQPGDIVLKLDVPERDQPIELTEPAGTFRGSSSRSSRLWKTRNNYLTNLLAMLGPETKVRLSYWRDGEVKQGECTIVDAPPDQDSAKEFKDERIGLTVKQLTYEVRSALNMKPDDPGLVVTKVESGSPAGLARIRVNEIVQTADGKPLTAPDKLETILKEAKADSKSQVRLVIVARGQPRFADLKLSSD